MKLRNLRMSQLQGTVDQGSAWAPVLSPFFFLSVYRFSHYQGNTMHTFVDALKITDFFFFFFFTVEPHILLQKFWKIRKIQRRK